MRVGRLLRSFLIAQVIGLVSWVLIGYLLIRCGPSILPSAPIYTNLPSWGVQEIYHFPTNYQRVFGAHKDVITDWTEPAPNWLYHKVECFLS